MRLISRLTLRTKLLLLLTLFALGLAASTAAGVTVMHQRMLADRIDKIAAIATVFKGFAGSIEAEAASGRIPREEAMTRFRKALYGVRFGGPDDYMLAQTDEGIVAMHGGDAKREGKPTASRDAAGRTSAELIAQEIGAGEQGVIRYLALRPGGSVPVEKTSYVVRFRPWKMNFLVGTWIDDVEAAYRASWLRLAQIGAGIQIGRASCRERV